MDTPSLPSPFDASGRPLLTSRPGSSADRLSLPPEAVVALDELEAAAAAHAENAVPPGTAITCRRQIREWVGSSPPPKDEAADAGDGKPGPGQERR